MEGRCAKHQFEAAEATCRSCGNEFCAECLVYSFGPKKPPYCIACALTAAGVRTTAANHPTKSKKELKQEARARRKADRQAVKSGAPGMDVEWSMPEDPTAGLTEEDLRLPTAPPDAAVPPPPPPPPPLAGEDPTEAELPAGVVVPAPNPEPTGAPGPESVPAATTPTDPPQFLLRQGPVPDLPGAELPAPAPLLAPVDSAPPPPAPPSALGLEDLAGPAPIAPAAPIAPTSPTLEPPPAPPPAAVSGPGAAEVPAPETVAPAPPGQEPPQFLLRQAVPPPRVADEVPLTPPETVADDPFGVGAVIPATPPPPPEPAAAPGAAALAEFGLGPGPVGPASPPDSSPVADLPTLDDPPTVDVPGATSPPFPGDGPFVATADEPEPFAPLPFEHTGSGPTALGPTVSPTEPTAFEPAPFDPTPIEPASFDPAPIEPASFEPASFEPAPFESGPVPPPPPPPPGLPHLAPATVDAEQFLAPPPPPPPPAETFGVDLGLDAPAPAETRAPDPEPPVTDLEPPVVGADDLFAPGTEAPAPGHAPFDASTFEGAALASPPPDPDPFDAGAARRLDRSLDAAPPDGASSTWDSSGKPLRVRDLLDDPDRPAPLGPRPTDTSGFTPRTVPGDEPAFFAPVTPEQLGDDPWPPPPPS